MESSKVSEILDYLCQHVGGDWLLVGGALVQIELSAERATEDIDLALISHPTKSEAVAQNELFQYSMKQLNIGPESVNLAVAPFLNDFLHWQSECKLLKSGSKGNIFRPSLTLFIALKLGRASTIDLKDIRLALEKFPREELNEIRLKEWLKPAAFQRYLELTRS